MTASAELTPIDTVPTREIRLGLLGTIEKLLETASERLQRMASPLRTRGRRGRQHWQSPWGRSSIRWWPSDPGTRMCSLPE